MATRIRWRLNDPAAENAQRWTKVHLFSRHGDDLTKCHLRIPEFAYMVDIDDQIPSDATACKRCIQAQESLSGIE